MSAVVTGVVANGVIVPNAQLPEGALVEIHVTQSHSESANGKTSRVSPSELRRMPREQRQVVLAAAAELAEQDYRDESALTDFNAFSEEEVDDDESHEG